MSNILHLYLPCFSSDLHLMLEQITNVFELLFNHFGAVLFFLEWNILIEPCLRI
jgi:hypothetical protein